MWWWVRQEVTEADTGNYWLTIFPEGTRCRPDKLREAQTFSVQRKLPVFQHTLVPRTKGLLATMGDPAPRYNLFTAVCCMRALESRRWCRWCAPRSGALPLAAIL